MSYRSICNKCGRTGLGDDFVIAQSKIDHKDSCPTQNVPKVVKAETKVVKPKKTPKKDPPTED